MHSGVASIGLLIAAWAFVAARGLMAIEACGRNKVMRRFQAFLAGCVALLALWVQLAPHWAGLI
ncbi:MAG TPA: hypothetical protein DCM32_02745 [Xanthomonadaceae bacterium]|jgi:hypothetical protein|nr:hypothetical protein [Xanthomonadaceae bacterium]